MQKKNFVAIAILLVAAAVVAALALLMTQSAPTSPPAPQEPVPAPAEPPRDTSHDDLIRVSYPRPGDVVASPLVVKGEARGTWYFEASFPVKLLDANGAEVVAFHASADGDWMTTEFVPFTAVLEFEHPPATPTGTLVLMNDNPSGDPARDDEVRIPVRFAPEAAGRPWRACKVSGCGREVCAEEEVVTDCIAKPENACYRDATCERQADGACGWTETPALKACLEHPPVP